MPGLMESLLAGASQGFSNATQQNNAAEIANLNRQTDFSIRELMDQRVAERALKTDNAKYERGRKDTLDDQKTAQTNALELQRERNKGYVAAGSSRSGGVQLAAYREYQKDNPDASYADFLRMSSSAKVDEEKQLADEARKIYAAEKAAFNTKYTIEQAKIDARKLRSTEPSQETAIPKTQNIATPAPAAAIDYLKKNPSQKEAFKQKYGYLPEGM